MGNGLFAGNMGSLRSNSFIFSRSVRLDRFALAAGHDLAGAGRLRRVYLLKMKLSPLAGFPPMNYLNNYHCITMKQQNKAAKMTARFSEPSGRATIPDELQRSENDPFLEIHQAVSKEAIRREALIGLLL